MAVAGLFALPATNAQSRLGIYAAYNSSTIKFVPDIGVDAKPGMTFGLTTDFSLGDFAAINITGLYSKRGCTYDGVHINLNYVESDLRLKIGFIDRDGAFYVMAGPRWGILTGSNVYDPVSGEYADTGERFDDFDLGYSGGIGFRLGPVFFEASYSGSLIDILLYEHAESFNKGLQIGGGISIPLGY